MDDMRNKKTSAVVNSSNVNSVNTDPADTISSNTDPANVNSSNTGSARTDPADTATSIKSTDTARDSAPSDHAAVPASIHEQNRHEHTQTHHHHTHASGSHHEGGHHLLQVEDLSISFRMYATDEPFFSAQQHDVETISNLSISVHVGEIVAVVGASGSGKTLLADAILGIFEPNATVRGRVWFDGILQDARSLQQLHSHGLSLVPQSVNYLDPLMKVGKQVEGFARTDTTHKGRHQRRQELFERYGLSESVASLYPFELSGGMARRVLLCCALMDDPRVIVADEPTPGLDLDLAVRALDDFRAFANAGGGVMLITHDIELALRVADRVAVFQNGTVVEETAVANFASPDTLKHPFSQALWHALPNHDFAVASSVDQNIGANQTSGVGQNIDAGQNANVQAVTTNASDAATNGGKSHHA